VADFAYAMARSRDRLVRAREAVAVGTLSGPVGSYSNIDPAIEAGVMPALGLRPAEVATQVVMRDGIAEWVNALAIVATVCEAVALEVRHGQRTEVRELAEPFRSGQKGSSAMPHKKNPITSEQISGLARVLRGNAQAALENIALWHERDISHSSVERVIFPDSTILADYLLAKTADLIDRLLVYPERITGWCRGTRRGRGKRTWCFAMRLRGIRRLPRCSAMRSWRGRLIMRGSWGMWMRFF
jgi:adenylosuccinate lyase